MIPDIFYSFNDKDYIEVKEHDKKVKELEQEIERLNKELDKTRLSELDKEYRISKAIKLIYDYQMNDEEKIYDKELLEILKRW